MNRSRAPLASAQASARLRKTSVARRNVGDRDARLHAVLRHFDVAGQRRTAERPKVERQDDVPVGEPRRSRSRGLDLDPVPLAIIDGQRDHVEARPRAQAPRRPWNRARRRGGRRPFRARSCGAHLGAGGGTKEGPPARERGGPVIGLRARLGGKRAKSGTTSSLTIKMVKRRLNGARSARAIPDPARLEHIIEGHLVGDPLRLDPQRARRDHRRPCCPNPPPGRCNG